MTYKESKSAVAKGFIRTFKGKIYKNVTANDGKSYLGYLNELGDKHNDSYSKVLFMPIILLCLRNMNRVINLLKLKFVMESGFLCIRIFLANVTLKIYQKLFLINLVLKANPWKYKVKDLNGEK